MIKKNLKALIITSCVIVLPVLAGLALWTRLPQQLPTHWNAAGERDGWSSKAFAVFALPLILLAAQWLCVLATLADPKKHNHGGKILLVVFWIIPVLSVVVNGSIYATALGAGIAMEVITPLLVGLTFVIIGNYLPKCKQNYTVGIKLPWTLQSEENWNRTHRMAGRLWVIGGIVILLCGFLGGVWLILPVTLIMVVAPMIYSYVLYRKGEDESNG